MEYPKMTSGKLIIADLQQVCQFFLLCFLGK